jgi:alpha-L-fucosidase
MSEDSQVRLLGATATPLRWRRENGRLLIDTPAAGAASTRSKDAYTFKITSPGMDYVRTRMAPTEVLAGHPAPVTLQVTNLAGHVASGTVSLSAPPGLTLTPSRFDLPRVAAGETVTLRATAASDTPGTYPVRITTDLGGRSQTVTAEVKVALPNVALGKPATQSSTDFGGTPDKAVDGNTAGTYDDHSFSHTAFEANPWWQVDLGGSHQIDSIDVWNRTDCCMDRLKDYYVFVSDQPFASTSLADTLAQPGVWSAHETEQAGRPTSIPVGRGGRYVRIQLAGSNWLTLPEVQVHARE